MSRSVSVVTNEGSDLSLEYDGYGRVAKKVLTREGRTILTVEYTYRNTDANSTTGQIASITIGTNGASRSYTYSYDANGNITSVTEGNNATTYTYDKAGQLLRENNQAAGKTWVWEYDDAGNIESRTEYAYTTGNLGAVLDTVEYQYNNDNWGDLLTSYDGNTITYDEIGNPLNDGTWEYTWEHGRQLASMTDGTVTVDYEYNADGIRTRKTVSTASDHSHIFQARVVAPTCTENGYTLHECSCGYSWQSNPVAATGHSFTTTEVEATCTAHGYTRVECECGYGYQEGSQGHTFTDTVVAPTAEENGYTLHECACGYSYQDTPVASLGITNPTANGTAANTVVYDYVYNGSSLSYLTVTSTNFGAESVTEELYFGNGTVTYGDDVYYYVTNLQGDVVAIIDADGNVKVEYTYDAWGKILSISGPMADTLGAVNPLTYRGYVYDTETDLYYLESRYYDPAVGRFINADALVSTGQGFVGNNMFAYCLNDPVNCFDDDGRDAVWIQEEESAAEMGHSGLLVECDGTWYFFYWGPETEDPSFWEMIGMVCFGIPSKCVLIEVKVEDEDLSTVDGVKKVVGQSEDEFVKGREHKITNVKYFEGDYSATYDELATFADNSQKGELYHLLVNNCVQKSCAAMTKSNILFEALDFVLIPNETFKEVVAISEFERFWKNLEVK